MGSYTNSFDFYEPNAVGEVVDVEQQINYNLDIVDFQARGLLDYEVYNLKVGGIDSATIADRHAGHKFYKAYSNSIYASRGPIFNPSQDLFAKVRPWVDASSLISTSTGTWQTYPDAGIYYRVIANNAGTNTEIEWCGRVWLGGSAITPNTNYAGVLVLPSSSPDLIPATAKYFLVNAGNCSGSGYAEARLLFNTNGNVEVNKQGTGTATASTENYVDFTGVKYSLEATG